MHQMHGAHDLALRCFNEALHVEPTFISPDTYDEVLVNRSIEEVTQWYYRLGNDLKTQGYEEYAEHIYRALLQWAPQEQRAHYLLANLLARTNRLDAALEEYSLIDPQDRHYVDARIRMSMIYKIQNNISAAYTVLFECAKLKPTNGKLFLAIGKLLYDMGKTIAAVRVLKHAVQLLPQDPQAYYLLGFVYMVIGYENWAIAAWRKAVELAPEAHLLRYDLGYLYLRCNRYNLAANEFARILTRWPEDVETNFMLGFCYKELSEPARAIPLFEKALLHNPHHAQALYHLGVAYLQIGNVSLGKAYLRRYDRLTNDGQQAPKPRTHLPRRVRPPFAIS